MRALETRLSALESLLCHRIRIWVTPYEPVVRGNPIRYTNLDTLMAVKPSGFLRYSAYIPEGPSANLAQLLLWGEVAEGPMMQKLLEVSDLSESDLNKLFDAFGPEPKQGEVEKVGHRLWKYADKRMTAAHRRR